MKWKKGCKIVCCNQTKKGKVRAWDIHNFPNVTFEERCKPLSGGSSYSSLIRNFRRFSDQNTFWWKYGMTILKSSVKPINS